MGTLWSDIDLPEVPSLGEVRRYARERLAQTPSLEEIAVRTRERLFELVFARLSPSRILAAKPAGRVMFREASLQNPCRSRRAGVLKDRRLASRESFVLRDPGTRFGFVAKPTAICGRDPGLVTSVAKLLSSRWITP